ncbi:hypothetical protein P280DRAFT_498252 [Massarina eburnea CBS 473.64]|uniref:Programmed cell death protein 2 C-terminal domain-containing protein n=1 Tax=Massarina eburnea CBS 473.64 TaxID=1395130 RepID=A0A6A6S1I4_9PLEO|nr:hypothetical protein P280DRAFT_498252 [Massarina eburnea CBS 473.64]
MPPYESDSSDEGEDYTETNVLLGYASEKPSGDTVSHLGGHPTWLDGKTAPSGALAKCKVCNGLLTLLLELNGDLPEHFPGHERRLYIWSCRKKTCRRKEGSVRGIRGVRVAKGAASKPKATPKPEEPRQEEKPQPQLGASLFGVKNGASSGAPANPFANPFSSNPPSANPANPFAKPLLSAETQEENKEEASAALPQTFAEKVRLSSPPPTQPARPHEPWPAESAFPPAFPCYFLDAEYETLDAPSTPQIPSNVRIETEAESSEKGGGKEDKDVFESSLDKTFQKFADRVGQNAEQILRYEFKGKPLLYSDSDTIGKALASHSENGTSSNAKVSVSKGGKGIPRCQSCGADRVFEAQLTTHAITELEADEMSIDGMEWGTILLGVCSRDCKPNDVPEGEVGYVEEWAGVQWEELASRK